MYLGSVGTYSSLPQTEVAREAKADIGEIAMGIMGLCPWYLGVNHIPWNVIYFSISLSLNVILTLMIVIKLAQHGRNIRAATGSPPGIGGLYRAVATMFIESSALFAVSLLLVTVSWATSSAALTISSPILGETQVRVFPRS